MGHICTSSVGVCEDLSLVIGLNLKRGVVGWVQQRISIVLNGGYLKGRHSSFLGRRRVNPLRRGGEATSTLHEEASSTVKVDTSELAAHCPQLHQGLPTCTHFGFEDPIPYQSVYPV